MKKIISLIAVLLLLVSSAIAQPGYRNGRHRGHARVSRSHHYNQRAYHPRPHRRAHVRVARPYRPHRVHYARSRHGAPIRHRGHVRSHRRY